LKQEVELLKTLRIGRVEKYLIENIEEKGAIHITLLDPDKDHLNLVNRAVEAEKAGTSAIMVGGSIGVSESILDDVIISLKEKVEIPIILFPGNISGVSRHADAIWFMSLLNSATTYYLVDAQAQGSLIIKKYGIEAIPMGYIIVGEGEAAGFIGQARIIPYTHPELAAIYALAGELLGMRFIYLEAGSGAKQPVPESMVRTVRRTISTYMIVGGGIKTAEQAKRIVRSGANIIVTGTVVEEENVERRIGEIVRAVEEGAN